MKPLTMLEFVLKKTNEITNEWCADDQIRLLDEISNYAQFLAQKPEKWMFVPCDEDGNVLEEPLHYTEFTREETQKYQQALERVIFDGFTSHNKNWLESEKISFILINNNRLAEYKNIYDLINEYGDFLTLKKPIQ